MLHPSDVAFSTQSEQDPSLASDPIPNWLELQLLTEGHAFSGYCICRQNGLYEPTLPTDMVF